MKHNVVLPEIDNIRYAKKQQKTSSDVHIFELMTHYDEYEALDFEEIGLGEKFERSLKNNLDHIHQVEPFNGIIETCGAVLRRSYVLASYMQKKKVKLNDVVLFCTRNNGNQSIAILASLFCGATVALIDLDQANDEWFVLNLKPVVAFCDSKAYNIILSQTIEADIRCEVIEVPTTSKNLFSPTSGLETHVELVKIPNPSKACAFMISTQGTTSRIKLVKISHLAIMYQLRTMRELLLKDTKKVLSFLPSSYFMQIFLDCLCFDQPITKVLLPQFDAKKFYKLIHDFQIDSIILTPHYCRVLCSNISINNLKLSCLRSIFLGGNTFVYHLVKQLSEIFKDVDFFMWYAATEVGFIAGMKIERVSAFLSNVIKCGPLYPSIRGRVVDMSTRIPVAQGLLGEICIQTPSMMLGYHPECDSVTEYGFFKTGDVGYYDDEGKLYVRGRIEEIINRNGEYFYVIDIEDVLTKYPGVIDSLVVGLKDEIVAFIEINSKSSKKVVETELKTYMKEHLREKIRPTQVKFYDGFPKTPIGHKRRYALEETLKVVEIVKSKSLLSLDS